MRNSDGGSWRITGASGREVKTDDVEVAGHAAWEMAHDDDAANAQADGGDR